MQKLYIVFLLFPKEYIIKINKRDCLWVLTSKKVYDYKKFKIYLCRKDVNKKQLDCQNRIQK